MPTRSGASPSPYGLHGHVVLGSRPCRPAPSPSRRPCCPTPSAPCPPVVEPSRPPSPPPQGMAVAGVARPCHG
nr:unnamed protein product [Digitaria exilis]